MKHTISILVENEFGALARIAGLFSGRGYNIESLTVAPTLTPTISRMTIVTIGNDSVIEQIIKQLNKLVNIIKVSDVTSEDHINKVLALIKINLSKKNREKVRNTIKDFDAEIAYMDDKCSIIQVVDEDERVKELVSILTPYGIMEYISTGNIALQKGKKVIHP